MAEGLPYTVTVTRDSLSAQFPTWTFSVSGCYVSQDHPVRIP